MAMMAVVWGAGGGIGRALVSRLGGEGWQALAIARLAAEKIGCTVEIEEMGDEFKLTLMK